MDERPEYFRKEKISTPDDARPGAIVVYDDDGGGSRSKAAKKWGHVEIKDTNGNFVHYISSNKW